MPDAKSLLARLTDGLKSHWRVGAGLAAWVVSVVGGFLRDPPPTTLNDPSDVGQFAQFFLTLAVLLMCIPVVRYRSPAHLRYWLIPAVGFTLLTPVAFFTYDHYREDWTAPFVGEKLLVGSEFTPQGQAYRDRNPDASDAVVLAGFAGKSYEAWTRKSIETRRLALNILYVFALPFFAAGMMSVLQAVDCALRPRRRAA